MAEKLKIISLGGLNEIGKNLTVYEYGGDIIETAQRNNFQFFCHNNSLIFNITI